MGAITVTPATLAEYGLALLLEAERLEAEQASRVLMQYEMFVSAALAPLN